MTVLANARATTYKVGTNLKGRGVGAAWMHLLPSLDIDGALVIGSSPRDELDAIEALATVRASVLRAGEVDAAQSALADHRLDLVLVGRGGSRLLRSEPVRRLAEQISPVGALYAHASDEALRPLVGAPSLIAVWPRYGPGRAFARADDRTTIEQLSKLGHLPPRGPASRRDRVLNWLASRGIPNNRSYRIAELQVRRGDAALLGPPRHIVELARSGGIAIERCPWAIVAPGMYASQKVLLLLFDAAAHEPWLVVKLGTHPAHAARLRNEAAALGHLADMGISDRVPALAFAGEHAGRGIVAQTWLEGRPFDQAATASADSPHLTAAIEWLSTLAATTGSRRPSADVGAALRDLFAEFRAMHRPPRAETAFLDARLRAIEEHEGSLPVVFQHGDPGTWNLLVDAGGQVSFLDWESAETAGLPLWDLFHLLASFGAWVAGSQDRRQGVEGLMRHLANPTALNARFADDILGMARRVKLPLTLVEPMFYMSWMHRALKEGTRRTPATLASGTYRRVLRELIVHRDTPGLRRLFAQDS